MSLLETLMKTGSTKTSSLLSDSIVFKEKDAITTDLPILNIAFSGDVDGGLVPGLSIISGESKTFKSALSLYCMKAYMDRFPDSVAVFYDSEFGITDDYIRNFGVDPSRVIHIPVEHIEQLKFDFVKKLEAIKKGDRVFFLVDSIGQLSSKKEVEDAIDEKSVADMTRAKAIRSLLRLITIQLSMKEIPCLMVNHVYQSIGGMYPQTIIPGGTAVTYSANTIMVITKAQEKKSGDLLGWKFTINIHKSRFVKEKARLPLTVLYDGGIQKYSGILDIALLSGDVIKPSNGWYNLVDTETGEILGNKFREKDFGVEELAGEVIKRESFKEFVRKEYKLGHGSMEFLDFDPETGEVIEVEEDDEE